MGWTAFDVRPEVALEALSRTLVVRELEPRLVHGRAYWLARESPSESAVIPADRPGTPRAEIEQSELRDAAAELVADARLVDWRRLEQFDSHYYSKRSSARPRALPVYRAAFDDSQKTRIYIDPRGGDLVLRTQVRSRIGRYLYQGLHSWDFGGFLNRRPWWDLTVAFFLLGGLALSVTQRGRELSENHPMEAEIVRRENGWRLAAARMSLALGGAWLLAPLVALGEETQWSNWRGPAYNGTSPDADPPVRWSESENVRFKVGIPGESLASPIVHEMSRVYLLTAEALDPDGYADRRAAAQEVFDSGDWPPKVAPVRHAFWVYALDAEDGTVVWRRKARESVPHESHYLDSSYACGSPLTDGERLYAHFGSNGTYAFSLDGEPLWQVDLGDMTTRRGFGEGSSPALAGERLIVNWDHEGESFIVALDRATGRELWRSERPGEVTSWSTPLFVPHESGDQVIVSSTGRSRGYDAETGRELWSLSGMTVNQIPTPLRLDDVVFLASGYRGSMIQAVDLDRAEGALEGSSAVLWQHERDTPYVATPLLYGEQLYFVKHFRGILTALDARTGAVRIGPTRLPRLRQVYASPVGAAGRVYFFGRDGSAVVLRHGPELEVIAQNELDDGVDGTPALVGKRMYVRSRRALYCLEEEDTASGGRS